MTATRIAVACGLGLLAAFFMGMVCQRFYGLGNLVSLATIAPPEPLPDLSGVDAHVFLLAGQSNMEGTGATDGYIAPKLSKPVYVLDDGRLSVAREPLAKSGIGPGVAFAERYLSQVDADCVILVPAAQGGTNIAKWLPSKQEGSLYAESIKRTLAASYYGDVRGVLFFQGENDTEGKPDDHAGDWAKQFAKLVDGWRADLGEVRVVFAQLGPGDRDAWMEVKTQQASVDLPGVQMIRTDDLPCVDQSVHFTTGAYLTIGQRFADGLGSAGSQQDDLDLDRPDGGGDLEGTDGLP